MQRKFDPADEQWLDYREVCTLRQCKKTKLYADVKDGRFPAPVMFGPRKARWALSWVDRHHQNLLDPVVRHNERILARRRST